MIERDRGGDALEDPRLARLGRRHDQAALAAADGGDQIDGPAGDAIVVGGVALAGRQLEHQALRGIERDADLLDVAQDLEAAPPVAAGAAALLAAPALLAVLHPRRSAHAARAAIVSIRLRGVVVDGPVHAARAPATPAILRLLNVGSGFGGASRLRGARAARTAATRSHWNGGLRGYDPAVCADSPRECVTSDAREHARETGGMLRIHALMGERNGVNEFNGVPCRATGRNASPRGT